MKRFSIPTLAAVVYLSLICHAQAGGNSPAMPYPAKPVPEARPADSYKTTPIPQGKTETPFSLDAGSSGDKNPVEYRSEDQVSPEDRALMEAADHAIRQDAAMAGIELDKGSWSREQILCRAMPEHIFLLFRGNNGARDMSLFTAAILRNGNSRVRILPIQRRGFALFSPAPVNELTVASFNRILADEPIGKSTDWLGTGLCYAALTGEHPQIAASPSDAKTANPGLSFPPTLEVGRFGESTVRFVDFADAKQAMQWALTFSGKGQLLKVEHFPTPTFAVNRAPAVNTAPAANPAP
jgi:hypothetical protein